MALSPQRRRMIEQIDPQSPFLINETNQMIANRPNDDFAAMARRDGINPDGSSMGDPGRVGSGELRSTGAGGSRNAWENAGGNKTFEASVARGVYDGTAANIVDLPFAVGQSGRHIYDDVKEGNPVNPVDAGMVGAAVAPVAGRAASVATQALSNISRRQAMAGMVAGGGMVAGSDALNAAWTPDQESRRKELQGFLAKGKFANGADRRSIEKELSTLDTLYGEDQRSQGELAKLKAQSEIEQANKTNDQKRAEESAVKSAQQGEYDRAVKTAESARDKALERDYRYVGSPASKVVESLGGIPVTAALAGLAVGAVDRLAMGKGGAGAYARRAAEGTGAAFGVNSLPVGYNALGTDTSNPQKDAYSAYARELPQGHPRKQEFADYANVLPDENPVRTSAQKEMYDPWKMAERFGASVIEGVPGAWTGSNLPAALAAGTRGLGYLREQYHTGQVGADAAKAKRTRLAKLVEEGTGQTEKGAGLQIASQKLDDVADGLAPPSANQGGASTQQAGGSSGNPNPQGRTTQGQGQQLERGLGQNSLDTPEITGVQSNNLPANTQQGSSIANQGGNGQVALNVNIPSSFTDSINSLVGQLSQHGGAGNAKADAALQAVQDLTTKFQAGSMESGLALKQIAADMTAAQQSQRQLMDAMHSGNQQAINGLQAAHQKALDTITARMDALAAKGGGGNKSTPPGDNPGKWAHEIAPTARDMIMRDADRGGSIGKGNGARLGRQLDNELPEAIKRPSEPDNRARVANMREILGTDKPTRDQYQAMFDAAPESVYRGKKIYSAAPIAAGAGAAAYGMSPDDAEAEPMNSVMDRRLALARAVMASSGR